MGYSIQEYLKIINSKITKSSYISLLITTVFLVFFGFYLHLEKNSGDLEVSYISDEKAGEAVNSVDQRPFGSKSGKTYTFTWCGGADRTKPENKIYFKTEDEAKASGRTLSKMCGK